MDTWTCTGFALLQELRQFEIVGGRANQHYSVAFSRDGSRVLASGTYSTSEPSVVKAAVLWDVASGKQLRRLEGIGGVQAQFSENDHFILTGANPVGTSGSPAYLWDMRDLLAKPQIRSTGVGRQIDWDLGTLQYSPTVDGPWTDLPTASPFPLSPIGEKGFFRQ